MESYEMKNVRFVLIGIFGTVLVLLGLIGNSLSIAIFSKPRMRSSINCILKNLAFFDIVVLIFWFAQPAWLGLIVKTRLERVISNSLLFRSYLDMCSVLIRIGYSGSVWSTIGITIERYIAVCYPFKAKLICTYTNARIWNTFAAVYIICVNLPYVVLYVSHESIRWMTTQNTSNQNESRTKEMEILNTSSQIYLQFGLPLLHILPFFVFVLLNTMIVRTLVRNDRKQQKLNRINGKCNLVRMLLCIVAITILNSVLHITSYLMQLFGLRWSISPSIDCFLFYFGFLEHLMVPFNSSVNFFIYCLTCQKFRLVLREMFCSCFEQRKSKREQYNRMCNISSVKKSHEKQPNQKPLNDIIQDTV